MSRARRFRAYPPEYWDDLAAGWDKAVDLPRGPHQFYYREADVLVSEVLGRNQTVLEVGCGAGGSTEVHAGQVARLIATDYSREMVRKARHRFLVRPRRARPDFAVCDAHRLPFRSGSFDVVFSRGVMLSYVKKPNLALSEARRVLRRRGRLALDAMNRLESRTVARLFRLQGRSPVYDEVSIKDGLQIRYLFRLPETAGYMRWARATRRCEVRPKGLRRRALSIERFEARMFRRDEIRKIVERSGFGDVRIVPLGHLAYLIGKENRQLVRFIRRNRGTLSKLAVSLADHLSTDTALHLFVIARKR